MSSHHFFRTWCKRVSCFLPPVPDATLKGTFCFNGCTKDNSIGSSDDARYEVVRPAHPLVTVGIPTFNRPKGLKRSLDCISLQTYANLEIIVSDNASPGDETRCVAKECMANDARIKYIRHPSNLGIVANFKYVFDVATGKYFLWMSDDDWRDPSYIEILVRELEHDTNAVLAFCDITVLDEKGNRRNDFYNSYLPYLQRLNSPLRLFRLMKFFLQYEGLGKANLIYGLIRRRTVKDISLDAIFRVCGLYGFDNLIVFILLGKGELKLVEGKLYGCTAGNVKHYAQIEMSGLKSVWRSITSQLRYLFAYVRLSDNLLSLIMVILFPLKFVSFYWHILRKRFTSLPKGKSLIAP